MAGTLDGAKIEFSSEEARNEFRDYISKEISSGTVETYSEKTAYRACSKTLT